MAKQKTSCPRYCNACYFSRNNNAITGRAKIFRRFFASIKPVICPRLSSFTSFIIFVHIFADLVNSQMLSFTPVCHLALSYEKNSTGMIKNDKTVKITKTKHRKRTKNPSPVWRHLFPRVPKFCNFCKLCGRVCKTDKNCKFPNFRSGRKNRRHQDQ